MPGIRTLTTENAHVGIPTSRTDPHSCTILFLSCSNDFAKHPLGSVVTASDLDVFSNFQEIGCLICKNQLPSGNFNHASHLNNEEPPEEKWDFLSRLFVPLKQITSSPCYWQFPLVKEMLLICRGAKLRAC